MSTGADILKEVLTHTKKNYNSLAREINVKTQNLYDIRDGKVKKITGTLAHLILEKYPEFNISWLMKGEGKMLTATTQSDDDHVVDGLNELKEDKLQYGMQDNLIAMLIRQNDALVKSTAEAISATKEAISINGTVAETNRRLADRVLQDTRNHSHSGNTAVSDARFDGLVGVLADIMSGKRVESRTEALILIDKAIADSGRQRVDERSHVSDGGK